MLLQNLYPKAVSELRLGSLGPVTPCEIRHAGVVCKFAASKSERSSVEECWCEKIHTRQRTILNVDLKRCRIKRSSNTEQDPARFSNSLSITNKTVITRLVPENRISKHRIQEEFFNVFRTPDIKWSPPVFSSDLADFAQQIDKKPNENDANALAKIQVVHHQSG